MWYTTFCLSLPLLLSATALAAAPSLFDALIQAGASDFAATIQADPVLLATYSSPDVGTIFAPIDLAAGTNKTKRQDTSAQQKTSLSAGRGISRFSTLGKPPGAIVATSDTSANLGGMPQNVVTDARNSSTSSSGRRWLYHGNGTTLPSLLTITSGLGHVVNVVKADIEYNGGVIHLIDNYFTVPETVSTTAKATGLDTFKRLADHSNLTAGLDNTPLTTVFLPSDAAFAAGNLSSPGAATAGILAGHIVPNFLGYLPALTNGCTLVTQGGKTLTVSIRGGEYYVNNARITQANIILPNGVAHVVDAVIQPNPPVVVSGGITDRGVVGDITVLCAVAIGLLFVLA